MLSDNTVILLQGSEERRITHPRDIPAGLDLRIYGSGCHIVIGEMCLFQNTTLSITATNVSITFGNQCTLNNMFIDINSGSKQRLEIGEQSAFFGGKIILRDKDYVKIGKACLCADGLQIWATDAHTLLDHNTQEVLNMTPEKLEIGDHCWIGADVHILKKGSLAHDTVVAMCSVVTKPFTQSHTVIGGHPAKLLKTNIDWSRATIPAWLKKQAAEKQVPDHPNENPSQKS